MKKFFIALGILLVVVGLVLACVFGCIRGFDSMKNAFVQDISAADEYKSVEIDSTRALNLDIFANSYSVYLRCSDEIGNKVQVKYLSEMLNKGVTIDIANDSNNNVTVEEDDESGWFPFAFFGDIFGKKRYIVVEVPSGIEVNVNVTSNVGKFDVKENVGLILGEVKCKLAAGSIYMDDVSPLNLTLRTEAGSVYLKNVTSKTVTLTTQAGSIKVNSLYCDVLDVHSDAGSVKVAETTATNKAVVKVMSGSVKCDVETEDLDIRSDAGSVNFTTAAKKIHLESNAGSVSGTINRARSEYNIIVEKSLGSSNISSTTNAGATGNWYVEVDVGSIHINFAN